MTLMAIVRQLWSDHRWPLLSVGLLVVVNIALAVALHYYLVPLVNRNEQLLIHRQAELHNGGTEGSSPVQQFIRAETALASFREAIPPQREFTGLIAELQKLADDTGLDLAQVNYRHEPDKDNQLLRSQLTFTITGDYQQIKEFVFALEQSPRLMIIQQLALQGVDDGGSTMVQLQITLETFFRPGSS